MASDTSKAPLDGAGGALGNAYHGQAISISHIPLPLAEIQINHVARRARLRPEIARIIAPLVFAGGADACR